MLNMQREIKIRRIGIISYGFTDPVDFARSLGLQAGDVVHWESEGDTATLRFYKVARTETPALMNQEAAVESA